MKVIYKYTLALTVEQFLELPVGAKILDIQVQAGELCAWAEIDKDQPNQERKIVLVGTGHALSCAPSEYLTHISTVQLDGMVWHFYECHTKVGGDV